MRRTNRVSPPFPVELSQMKLKMQRKDLELKLCQSKKMKELVQSKLEMQKEALEESKRAEQKLLADQKQLTDEVSSTLQFPAYYRRFPLWEFPRVTLCNSSSTFKITNLPSTFQQVKELKIREHQLKQENEKLKNYLRKATN